MTLSSQLLTVTAAVDVTADNSLDRGALEASSKARS